MGGADAFGLNLTVNSVNGGRNVPFKWEVFDDSTGLELTDPARVEIQFVSVCPVADPVLLPAGRDVAAAESQRVRRCRSHDHPDLGWYRQDHCTEVHERAVQRGHPVPTRPAPSAWNCYVAWTRVIGDPSPGIVSLFTLT